jgi:hypothetical protein
MDDVAAAPSGAQAARELDQVHAAVAEGADILDVGGVPAS